MTHQTMLAGPSTRSSEPTMSEVLYDVLPVIGRAVAIASGAGVVMLDRSCGVTAAVATSPQVGEIEAASFEVGGGPGNVAGSEGRTVRVDDVRSCAELYPRFVRAALADATLSSVAVPLLAGTRTVGVLSVYAESPGAFDSDRVAAAESVATLAARLVALTQLPNVAADQADGLRTALGASALVEQAKGIVMAAADIGVDEAMEALQAAARREGAQVEDVAFRVVARTHLDALDESAGDEGQTSSQR